MAEHPFNLNGPKILARGQGKPDADKHESGHFTLETGVAILETKHAGENSLKVEIIPTEGFTPGQATAISTTGGLGAAWIAGAATGATLGSVVPGLGTILGGIAGAATGYFAHRKASDFISEKIAPTFYQAEWEGPIDHIEAFLVSEEESESTLPTGTYKFAVHSRHPWECRIIQPALGQSFGDYIANWQRKLTLSEPGTYTFGPHKVGTKPVLANAMNEGKGRLLCAAYSLDGTHQTEICNEQGQFRQESFPTELKPNKEYLTIVYADCPWQLWCSEGY